MARDFHTIGTVIIWKRVGNRFCSTSTRIPDISRCIKLRIAWRMLVFKILWPFLMSASIAKQRSALLYKIIIYFCMAHFTLYWRIVCSLNYIVSPVVKEAFLGSLKIRAYTTTNIASLGTIVVPVQTAANWWMLLYSNTCKLRQIPLLSFVWKHSEIEGKILVLRRIALFTGFTVTGSNSSIHEYIELRRALKTRKKLHTDNTLWWFFERTPIWTWTLFLLCEYYKQREHSECEHPK